MEKRLELDYVSSDIRLEVESICHEVLALLPPEESVTILSLGRSTKIFENFDWGKHHFLSVPLTNFRQMVEGVDGGWIYEISIEVDSLIRDHLEKYGISNKVLSGKIVVLDFAVSGNALISFLKFFLLSGLSAGLEVSGLALYQKTGLPDFLQQQYPECRVRYCNISTKIKFLSLLRLKVFKAVYPNFSFVVSRTHE